MKSMTGFANLEVKQKDHSLEIRVKSLNSRFLELRLNLPPDMAPLEGELRRQAQKWLRRGNVDISIYRRPLGDKVVEIKSQLELAKKTKEALEKIAKKIGDKQKVNLDHILKVVNPLQINEHKAFTEKDKQDLLAALDKVLKAHDAERLREGKSIVKEIKSLLVDMQKNLEVIQRFRSKVSASLQKKYSDRLKALAGSIEVDPQRLQQEIVLQIDRTDIHEEIVRLSEHIRSFDTFLKQENGKKLDFYTQELLREANTIGSKAQVVEITNAIVNIKCQIERIRELVQNLE